MDQPVEVRIQIDGLKATGTPDKRSVGFDRILERNDATSFVFIPLAKLKGKKKRHKALMGEALARKKDKLPEGNWIDGELRKDGDTVPGVLALDIRRRDAREIAETIGVKQFVWGAHGEPIEQHFTKIYEDDDAYSWSSARRRALDGLQDIVTTIANMRQLPQAVEESQTTMKRFRQLVYLVLGLALAAGLAQIALLETQNWLINVTTVAFYPFVIPAMLVGLYLRALMKKAEMQHRDFTALEAKANWTLVAPHLLALWVLCFTAVVLLTWLQSVPSTELPFLGSTSSVSTSFIVCVWMLLPIAHSRAFKPLLSSAIESGINALLSIFTIKISLFVTNLISDVIWEVAAAFVPFDIPELLQRIVNTIINFGAEVFFLAVLLGYAWSTTRQQFMRL
ncbi:MAG: hypothetical protein KJO54_13185 [Gammaproteobacteria bacterium]|nr:hypothetical protein [Gammaproteobacteria bacterium]NNF60610.1 hypothetical protein [Gammaproteobacteria bacterium]